MGPEGAAGDVLTLRNHSSSAAVTLQTLVGGTQTSIHKGVALLRFRLASLSVVEEIALVHMDTWKTTYIKVLFQIHI